MKLLFQIKRIISRYLRKRYMSKFPHVHPTASISRDIVCFEPQNLYMEEYTRINPPARISTKDAKFIMKKWSGAAAGLYVIPGNHINVVGMRMIDVTDEVKREKDLHRESDRDVVVEEDVWIGARVSLLNGVHIGRGAIVGTGAVVRSSIPPYSIVIGNPAKIVGFRFTPEEIIEHEKNIYNENDRFSLEQLQKNYEKYFINRMKEIKQFTKI